MCQGVKPSIAAVVGSVDPTAQMKYAVEIRVQHTEQNEEVIQDMAAIVTKLLKKFHAETKGQKPRFIFLTKYFCAVDKYFYQQADHVPGRGERGPVPVRDGPGASRHPRGVLEARGRLLQAPHLLHRGPEAAPHQVSVSQPVP